MITAEIRTRVTTKIQHGIDLAKRHYNIEIPMPTVVYKKRGTTAGTANYRTWTIDLNPVLLVENVDKFIERTVPHELAHLICDLVYPHAHRPGRGAKRDVHGSYWKDVMRTLGVPHHEITRCHSYDVSNASTRTRIQYRCTGCNQELGLTPAKHATLQKTPDAIWHRGCRGHRLVPVGSVAAAKPAVVAPAPAAVKKAATGTKLDQCYAIYKRLQQAGDLTRAYAIAAFMDEVGMTKAGASTYYSACQKKG